MSTSSIFDTLAQHDAQLNQHDQDVAQQPKDVFDQIAAGQPSADTSATPQPEQPSFGQRVYEESGLKGIIDTAKQKWANAQASAQEENKMASAAAEAIKSKNYGQAAELLLSHISKHINDSGILTGGPVPGMVKDLAMSELESGAGHLQQGVEHVKKGEFGKAALEGVGLIPGLGSTNDRAIQDIKSGNVEGVTGDVVGGGIKAGAMALGDAALGAIGPEAEEAGEAATKSGPGLVKQVIKGKEVAQEPAKAALGSAVESTGGKVTPGIRTMMDKTIATSAKAERAAYDTVNKAAGTDLKDLYDYQSRLQDAIDNPANIDREDLLKEKLDDVSARISHAEADATKNLVNAPKALDDAKALTQKRYAQQELKKKLFNNESVVSGNVANNAEETINVDSAIRQVEQLDKPSRYAPEGSPTRLVQALGKDGAGALKQGLYDAQKAGQTALKKQQIAKWIGGLAGVGVVGEGIKHAIQ